MTTNRVQFVSKTTVRQHGGIACKTKTGWVIWSDVLDYEAGEYPDTSINGDCTKDYAADAILRFQEMVEA